MSMFSIIRNISIDNSKAIRVMYIHEERIGLRWIEVGEVASNSGTIDLFELLLAKNDDKEFVSVVNNNTIDGNGTQNNFASAGNNIFKLIFIMYRQIIVISKMLLSFLINS